MQKSYFIILFVFYPFLLLGQTTEEKEDSLIHLLQTDSTYLNDFQVIEDICTALEEVSKENKDGIGVFYSNMVKAYLFKNSPLKAEEALAEMDKLIHKYTIPDTLLVDYHLAKGFNQGLKSNTLLELKHYLIADSIASRIKDNDKK